MTNEKTLTSIRSDNFKRKKITQTIWFSIASFSAAISVAALLFIIFFLFKGGASVLSWEFVFDYPRRNMTQGGIWPAIVGTFYVSVMTIAISVPLGISAAIYLNEYAGKGKLVRIIRLSIRNLSGVPSIVYGLFGMGLFAATLKLGTSLLAASLTLALMALPWVITASEEALKSVPNSFREGGLALGATKWQTIKTLVLPSSIPGMITGSILGLARTAGETAPIILTGAAFFLPMLPSSVYDQFMALPYHIFILSTQHTATEIVRPIAFGSAIVLVGLVLLMNSIAIVIRSRFRKARNW